MSRYYIELMAKISVRFSSSQMNFEIIYHDYSNQGLYHTFCLLLIYSKNQPDRHNIISNFKSTRLCSAKGVGFAFPGAQPGEPELQ